MSKPNLLEAKKRTKSEVQIRKNDYKIEEDMKKLGCGKTYYVKTYGCQMNEHDSEVIRAILEDMGYTASEELYQADLVILNTCAIRENAHNKVFGMLGRLKNLKQQRPVMIGLCGCMAQEEVVISEIEQRYRHLDFVFGTHNIHTLPNLLKKAVLEKKQEIDVWSTEGDIIEELPVRRDSKYKAWVNIMYGCDKFCTYCIVPYTRGKQRSRMAEDILKEVQDLVEMGYQEVTLLGQNVNAYGKDLEGTYSMANLLEDVAKLGISRIRFVTSHPWDFTDDMIEVIRKYDNVMPYIHLPLQAGSNRILKLMGRRYTKETYLELFHKLKRAMPECAITTDIIVGFPNETEEDFQETLDVVKECQYDSAFTFIYSPREGTPASKIQDTVSLDEKNERLQRLNQFVNQFSLQSNQRYVGKTVKVLIEDVSKKDDSCVVGYTETMKLVNVKGDSSLLGKIVSVKITDAKTWSMDGEIA